MDFVVRWERSEEDGLWWALIRWLGFDRISGEPWGDSWARESWLTQDLRRKRVVREQEGGETNARSLRARTATVRGRATEVVGRARWRRLS